jgi:ankyrin repeat protein
MGYTKLVAMSLDEGADINKTAWYVKEGDSNGRDCTPLMAAAVNGNTDTVKLLLEHGADVSYKDILGRNAMYNAVLQGYTECVALLLRYNSDVHDEDVMKTPVIFAAVFLGHVEIVRMLLRAKVNVMTKTSDGFHLYEFARGNQEIVTILDDEKMRLDKILSFSMSHHPRLGVDSMAVELDPEVLRMVLSFV